MRADAKRNYARILAVAEDEVAAHGANASVEQIARVANVGSATVRRHFPTRHALLEAVSKGRVEALAARTRELETADDSREALLGWLGDVLDYSIAARGLAAALAYDSGDSLHENGCTSVLEAAAGPLLARAAADGAVASDVRFADIIALIIGIVLVTERRADQVEAAGRLFRVAVAGLSPG